MGLNETRQGWGRTQGALAPTPSQLDDARASLRARFLVLAPRRVAALREALLLADVDDAARVELRRLGHQLRGTAATIELPALGSLGGVIERCAAAAPYTAGHHAAAAEAVELVAEAVARARGDASALAAPVGPRVAALVAG